MPTTMLTGLLVEQVEEIRAGEQAALGLIPKLAKAANSAELARVLRTRADQTRDRLDRLDRVLRELDAGIRPVEAGRMKGLQGQYLKLTGSRRAEPHVRDAALIAVALHAVHEEIAGYACARTWAVLLGLDKIAGDLGRMLAHSRRGDAELTRIAEGLNLRAASALRV